MVSPSSPPLRAYLLEGKFFIAAALASTLTKLGVRYVQHVEQASSKNVSVLINACDRFKGLEYCCDVLMSMKAFCGEAMLIIASILHLGRSGLPKKVAVMYVCVV